MLRILEKSGLLSDTMEALKDRIEYALSARFKGAITLGVIVFTGENRELFRTGTANAWMEESE